MIQRVKLVCARNCYQSGKDIVVRKIDDMEKRSPRQPVKVNHIDRLIPYKEWNPPNWYRGGGNTVLQSELNFQPEKHFFVNM